MKNLTDYINEGCNTEHCIVKDAAGNWRIKGTPGKGTNTDKEGLWAAKYKSEEDAKAALQAYFANKNHVTESKATTGSGSIEMIQAIIDELHKHPDMKGKDKEIWASCGQFLWDYLKELDEKTLANIMDTFDLVKINDWEETTPHDVQLGLWEYITRK